MRATKIFANLHVADIVTGSENSVISVRTDDVDAAYAEAVEQGYEITRCVPRRGACVDSSFGPRTATSSTS